MTQVKFRNNNGELLRDAFVPRSFAHLIDNFFNDAISGAEKAVAFRPSADILEKENAYEIHMGLPGLSKEDVNVELAENKLTISGNRKFQKEEGVKYHAVENVYGEFRRSFNLPKNADSEGISASFSHGILVLTINKSEEKKPKAIEIK